MTDTSKTPAQTNPAQPEAPLATAARVLEADLNSAKSASQLLYDQAALLDALFAQLMRESITTRLKFMSDEPYRHVDREVIELGLRAQKQCRQTLDAVAIRVAQAKNGKQTERP